MLVKLAFAMQRLKKYLRKSCHDQQRWGGQCFDFVGGHNCYEEDRAHGGPPSPPTRENPVHSAQYTTKSSQAPTKILRAS